MQYALTEDELRILLSWARWNGIKWATENDDLEGIEQRHLVRLADIEDHCYVKLSNQVRKLAKELLFYG